MGNQSYVFLVEWLCLGTPLVWTVAGKTAVVPPTLSNCSLLPTFNISNFAADLINQALDVHNTGGISDDGNKDTLFDSWTILPTIAAGVLLSSLLIFVYLKSKGRVTTSTTNREALVPNQDDI